MDCAMALTLIHLKLQFWPVLDHNKNGFIFLIEGRGGGRGRKLFKFITQVFLEKSPSEIGRASGRERV